MLAATLRAVIAALAVSVLVAGCGRGAERQVSPPPCKPRAEVVPTPDRPSADLEGVAAAPGGDIWAVGESLGATSVIPSKNVILGWHDGRVRAMPVPSEHGVTAFNDLRAVAAPADDDAWAVGNGPVLHWDGQRWQRVPAPAGSYWGISASSRDDVWAVGIDVSTDDLRVIHWDGSTWKLVPFLPIPAPGPIVQGNKVTVLFQRLYAVHAFAPNDVWVVGDAGVPTIDAHWDGKHWTSYPIKNGNFAHLEALAAVSREVVWAAGPDGSLIEWSHEGWQVRGVSPNIAFPIAVRAGRLWGMTGLYDNILAEWNGSRWVRVEKQHDGVGINALTVAPDGTFWAVGLHTGSQVAHRSLMLHYRCAIS